MATRSQQFDDTLNVTIFKRDGVNVLRVAGKKAGRRIEVERVIGGDAPTPEQIAQYILDADMWGDVDTSVTGEYKIRWETETLTDEEGNTYERNVITSLDFRAG